jgi:hypothetical protein
MMIGVASPHHTNQNPPALSRFFLPYPVVKEQVAEEGYIATKGYTKEMVMR